MIAVIYSLLSVLFISLVSLVGFFSFRLRTDAIRSVTFVLVSFAVGAMFGDVFFHILPEMAEDGFSVGMGMQILLGLLLFFVMEKFIAWRHCHIHTVEEHHLHPVAYMNLLGDGMHNFLDGLVIASSYAVSPVLGFSTTLAVFFHELPQEIGDFGILVHSGLSVRKALLFNFFSALAAIAGCLIFFVIQGSDGLSAFVLPLTVGGFLYLAGSDLMPELHKETRAYKSLLQLAAILFGLGIMLVLRIME